MYGKTVATLTGLFLLACSGSGSPIGQTPDDNGLGDASDVTIAAEVHIGVDIVDSGFGAEVVLDLKELTQPDISPMNCLPGEGCFLDNCVENGDCQSGWCVEHMGEKVCSQTCDEECPAGWLCAQVGAGPDLTFVCVSPYPNLCLPCASADDCDGVTGTQDPCVTYGEQGSFCGGACGEDGECPWGFACQTAETVDGVELQQCVAETGECPCTDAAVKLGLFTPCQISNQHGSCHGKRVCTDTGLTQCDAHIPAEEECNGLDDDCDEDVDEPLLVDGDFVNLCQDENECTADKCEGTEGCVNEVLESGVCQDSNPCTVADHCVAGTCVGDPVQCDDENPCTDNVCTADGGCEYPFVDAPCDDGNPCTVGDQCEAGQCEGTEVSCDCLEDADCLAWEDGDLCNGTLVCDTLQFPHRCAVAAETVVECPEPEGENTFCLQSHCDPDSGGCSVIPHHEGFFCQDSDACTVETSCAAGVCTAGVLVNCNDGNPCTDDSCDTQEGCVHIDNESPCSDGDVCTVQNVCQGGQCTAGAPLVCDDGNVCNGEETCDWGTGCQPGVILECDDGNVCNGQEKCSPLDGCQPGVDLGCYDQDVCTSDTCDTVAGCQHQPLSGTGCDDGNACTATDTCLEGVCTGLDPLDCGDDNPCTDTECDPSVGCKTTMNQAPCNDSNLCTTGDHCHLGECIASDTLPCDDGNLCTDDSCNPQSGCAFAPNQAPCDDADVCSEDDTCSGGWCSGAPVVCDDFNQCTQDSCVSGQGCNFAHVPDQTPCSSVANGQCVSGICQCVPDCQGKDCGWDGCQGSCGECPEQHECVVNWCVCVPDCLDKSCGDDGCGGTCGNCPDQHECVDFSCQCVPDCDGVECGEDGCGGQCGQCSQCASCVAGQCQPLPLEELPLVPWGNVGGFVVPSSNEATPFNEATPYWDVEVGPTNPGFGGTTILANDSFMQFTATNMDTKWELWSRTEAGGDLWPAGGVYRFSGAFTARKNAQVRVGLTDGQIVTILHTKIGTGTAWIPFADWLIEVNGETKEARMSLDGGQSFGNWTNVAALSSWQFFSSGHAFSYQDDGYLRISSFEMAGCQPCQPSCQDSTCGDDGCGGSCGECGPQANCVDGVCLSVEPQCLVAQYTLDGHSAEGTGTGNDCTVKGPVPASDRFQNALSAMYFDGNDDWIDCGDSGLLEGADQFAVSLWVRLESLGANPIINKWYSSDTANRNSYALKASDDSFSFMVSDGTVAHDKHQFDYAMETGIWYHLVAVFNEGAAELFVNGQSQGVKQGAITTIGNESDPLKFGDWYHQYDPSNPSPSYYPLHGTLDDVRLFTCALDQADVNALYGVGQ